MYVYAGIDEAGYGPLLGPLVVGRAVLAIPKLGAAGDADARGEPPPSLWQRLGKAVCRGIVGSKGRLVVNDSKKVYSGEHGLTHLERGVLAFAHLAGCTAADVGQWLDYLDGDGGDGWHRSLQHLPWYQPCARRPWQPQPLSASPGELAVARNLLRATCERIGVTCPELGAAVVFEDRFNHLVTATRSKASASFTFVARHLCRIWEQYGEHDPLVIVDRQSGRSRYRELLQPCFDGALLTVLDETDRSSAYRLTDAATGRAMTVRFEVDGDGRHMPTALASMVSKYCREVMMQRFQRFFGELLPDVAPTAGYALDGRRFWNEVRPHLPTLGLDGATMVRIA